MIGGTVIFEINFTSNLTFFILQGPTSSALVCIRISFRSLAFVHDPPLYRLYLSPKYTHIGREVAIKEVSEMIPKTSKGGVKVDEHRKTPHPALVTEGLMTQLLALGKMIEDPPILRSLRDEVKKALLL